MSQIEANEQARRNYALEAFTLGEENFLQIRCGGEVIATVTAPAGPSVPTEFVVFNGNGMTEDDEEDPKLVVKRFPTRGDSNAAWREAARFGYQHALAKMMTQDVREEREAYGLVA